jgi:hypothetical protein
VVELRCIHAIQHAGQSTRSAASSRILIAERLTEALELAVPVRAWVVCGMSDSISERFYVCN